MAINEYTPRLAAWYDEVMTTGQDYGEIAQQFHALTNGHRKVLELGIGTGLFAEQLVQKGYQITGIDFSPAMLAQARKRFNGTVPLLLQNVVDLQLLEQYEVAVSHQGVWNFTCYPCSFSLESHLTQIDANVQGLRKVAQHLVPGGLLVINIQVPSRNTKMPVGENAFFIQNADLHSSNSFVKKDYLIEKDGKLAVYQHCDYLRLNQSETEDLLTTSGFCPRAVDRNDGFFAFQKF